MNTHRAIVRTEPLFRRAIALAVLLLPGCRDENLPDPLSAPPVLRLLPGDRFVYDVWSTNVWGYTQDTSRRTEEWRILSAGPGGSGLIHVGRVVTPLPPRPVQRDTFLLFLSPDGAIIREGFLAEVVASRTLSSIPARWDTLVDAGRTIWRVGTADSAGLLGVSGSFGRMNYVDATINGTSCAFPAQRVELRSEGLEYDFWYSVSPPAVSRWEEYPDPYSGAFRGSLGVLRDAVLVDGRLSSLYFSRSSQSRTW